MFIAGFLFFLQFRSLLVHLLPAGLLFWAGGSLSPHAAPSFLSSWFLMLGLHSSAPPSYSSPLRLSPRCRTICLWSPSLSILLSSLSSCALFFFASIFRRHLSSFLYFRPLVVISASGWMVSFRLLASLIAYTLDIRPLMATLGWRIVATSSFRFFLLLPMSFWSSCALVFISVILPPSAPFLCPHTSYLPRWFSSALRFHSRSLFPIHSWGFFPVRFSLMCVLFIIGGRFSSCSGSFSFGLQFLFCSHCGSSPSLAPPLLWCFCYTCCFCLLCGSPLTCFSFTLSFSLVRGSLSTTCCAYHSPPAFSSLDCLPRGLGCGFVCFLLPFPVFP